jgi:hypothetical protein
MTEKDAEDAEKLWMELVNERARLDGECRANRVEQKAPWCQQAMSSVLKAPGKKISMCARLKTWWNADITERRRTVGRERRRRQNSEEAAWAKGKLQKVIRQSERKMWDDYLVNLRGAEL